MSNSDSLRFNRPALFSPSVIRNITEDTNGVTSFTKSDFNEVSSTAIENTASFKYSLPGEGIKSTQQLNVDWSSFETHTFYNSARVKTQVAFDKIVNQFPFDGTEAEHESFFDSLTGFEKYVYDQLPKNKGYLFFSGTNGETSGGTYITTKDVAGTEFPVVSRLTTGESILDASLNSITIEFQLFYPAKANGNEVILQKVSGSSAGAEYGYAVGLSTNVSTASGTMGVAVCSGSTYINVAVPFQKNQFNHFAFVWDRNPNANRLYGYLNGQLSQTSNLVEISVLQNQSAPLYIGSGSAILTLGYAPTNTLSGALDELRIWHSARTKSEIQQYQNKSVFADDDLKLYYKFNEPSGSNSRIVLDHSKNSLHGMLSSTGYTLGVREKATGSLSVPMTYEKLSLCPILFPEHSEVSTLREEFLEEAEEFDANNPNLITKLIPRHYLLEGQAQDALDTEEGSIVDSFSSEIDPKTSKLGDTQLLLSILWVWAKYFDELKLYIQAFGDLFHIDYDSNDTVPDQFLQFLANRYGFKLPPLFNGASIPQFVNADNLDTEYSTGQYSLQYIQNQIWRRILINLRDITTSKGTIHSVKSFIRSVGIDPDNNFRIREFGGPTKRSLSEAREVKSEISTLLNFISGGFIQSRFLSGSKTEPGWPESDPTKPNGVSFSPNGLFTSGNWTYEGIYKYETNVTYSFTTQSLVRFHITGSSFGYNPKPIVNLVAVSGSGLTFYVFPTIGQVSSLTMTLTGANIFDGNLWNISFGKLRRDYITSSVSSSFFLNATKQMYGEITEQYSTSSYYNDEGTAGSWFTYNDGTTNISGAFIAIGSQSIDTSNWNTSAGMPSTVYSTGFEGRVGHIRFWSKGLSTTELNEHVRNFKSVGVQNPLTNFNFVSGTSGSFEKLRLDVSTDQIATGSNASGLISLIDFSQNNNGMAGSLFPATSSVIVPQRFYYSHISPKFDEASTNNKVRVRSYLNPNDITNNTSGVFVGTAPVYEIERSEMPTDNTKFTIDFSVVDALNQDIINIFATLDSLDNIIGNPELIFSMDYPKLEELRTVYFNRLTDKVNLKGFFEFFKWFDTNIGSFISQLIPRKTKYLGTNFVVESHMLERPKMEYFYSDIYIGENHRHGLKDTILLSQFVGKIGRF